MESIPKQDCRKIGYFQKPHGIKGELVLQMEEDFTESLEEYPTVFVEIDGLLVPFFIAENGLRSRSSESALLRFDWIENEDQARKLCGSSVYLKNEDIIWEEEDISLHQLVGYTLFDSIIGTIGKILQVDDYSGNLLLTVEFKEREVLVPFNEDFLIRFDEEKREIELQCPEGIFEE